MLKKLGKESRFVDGLRCTDAETMDVVQQVLCGKVNKNLAATPQPPGRAGHRPVRLGRRSVPGQTAGREVRSGGRARQGGPRPGPGLPDGWLHPRGVHRGSGGGRRKRLQHQRRHGCRQAGGGSGGQRSSSLLTDVHGLLRDPADESTLLQKVGLSEVPLLVREGVIQGGMIPKVECCVEAVRSGVERTHILDGRIPHSILIELLSDEGHRHHDPVRRRRHDL